MNRLYTAIAALFVIIITALASAQVESTNLWNAGIGGYATYRVPGIVVTKRGAVLAYCGGRKELNKGDWSSTDILLRRSLDGGKTWEPSRRIAGNGQDLTDNIVAIADMQTGAVHFLYQKNYLKVFEIDSNDDGRSFTPEREITSVFNTFKPEYEWNVVTPGTGHGIQLKNGKLIASIWIANGTVNADGTRGHSPAATATIYSDDHGKSWRRGALIARDSDQIKSPNETVATQLPDGRVMVNIRSGGTEHLRAVSISDDGISNWSPPQFDGYLFDPTCAAGILTAAGANRGKPKVYFSNPDSGNIFGTADRKWHARENLTIKVSEDNGSTWAHQQVIDPGSAGYSDLASVGDDILVVYESGSLLGSQAKPAHLVVARVSKVWLQSGPAPQAWRMP